jgi:hypothetical protein
MLSDTLMLHGVLGRPPTQQDPLEVPLAVSVSTSSEFLRLEFIV